MRLVGGLVDLARFAYFSELAEEILAQHDDALRHEPRRGVCEMKDGAVRDEIP